MNYRHLKKEEINRLLSQNCFAESWTDITVSEGFSPENIVNSRFDGNIKLGIYSGTIEVEKKMPKKCGIYNSSISNCEIGDHVYISEVKNLSNYIIERDVAVSNTASLVVTGETTFGNGTELEVLNEGGGRELPIFDRLSSQTAYLTVLYRHDKDFTDKILDLTRNYCESKRSDVGLIESGTRILNSLYIRNVNFGNHAVISGVSLLEEGTIRSCIEAPVFIGTGVTAKKFIVLSGSIIDGGAMLEKCFVGQGVRIGRQFSAENSVFFANCEAYHGEACSLFAGPYTVTHHKSTLMIASLVSFFNAGSGTNQSNHMYKLGPLHQGVLERGCKTGSFSYLLLPVHIGAFSVVMGKHYSNFDTSDLPFSYITEEKGKSELTPAMNLFTVGTRRDIDKWPARDRRNDPDKQDLIHFDLFNPYIAGKIIKGIEILNELSAKSDLKHDYVIYKGVNIRRLLLKTTRKYYEIALKSYIGQEVVKCLRELDQTSTIEDLREMLTARDAAGTGRWVDVCGLLSPAKQIDELVDFVKAEKINSIGKISEKLASIYNNYDKYAWQWCSELICRQTGEKPVNMTPDTLIQIITDWKINSIKLNNMILKDAEKEFDTSSKFGFGVDGDSDTIENDFKAVRGTYDDNKFVVTLKKESKEIEEKADRLISILESFK